MRMKTTRVTGCRQRAPGNEANDGTGTLGPRFGVKDVRSGAGTARPQPSSSELDEGGTGGSLPWWKTLGRLEAWAATHACGRPAVPASLWLALLIAAPGFLLAQSPNEAIAPPEAARVVRATEVSQQWQPHQHLYVKGDLGVSRNLLDQLEAWLDAHATNWTVLLAESASGESYTDSNGRTFSGLDAVEHALGQGLPNQTAFGQLLDPRTQERNGAFFILFLKDRKFSYYGSDAQDRRGLGEDRWVGTLDQPAIAAMRSGGRIVDAVKDTITSIDRQLAQRIAAEIAAREQKLAQEKAARAQAIDQAKAAIPSAGAALYLLERKTREFNQQHPGLTGEVARPDLPRLQANLASAESSLAANQIAAAAAAAMNVKSRAEELMRLMEDYQAAAPKLELLEGDLKVQSARPYAASAGPSLPIARDALSRARQAYDSGDPAYAGLLETAQHTLASAGNTITLAERAAEQARQLRLLLGLASLLGLAGLGWGLNRHRKGAQVEALELLQTWEKGLGEKNVALFNLLDQVSTVVGASVEEAAQRYSGETRQLSEQIIQDVDQVFIMSSCAGRILRDARALATPPGALQKFVNRFAAAKYRAAVRLLRDEPIRFRPEEALELVVRGPKSERDALLGHLDAYQPFAMSFNQLIETFNQRASRALSAIDLVEASVIKVGKTLEMVQAAIDQVRSQETKLVQASRTDGWLGVPSVFGKLLPAAQQAQAEAVKIAVSDAVGALKTHGAAAQQRAEDAQALVNLALHARQSIIPPLQKAGQSLAAAGLATDWIDSSWQALSDRADALAQQAASQPAAVEIQALKIELDRLDQRTQTAVALDQVRRETAQTAIAAATATIAATRHELGTALRLSAESVLRESGMDPSPRVNQAIDQISRQVGPRSRRCDGGPECVGRRKEVGKRGAGNCCCLAPGFCRTGPYRGRLPPGSGAYSRRCCRNTRASSMT